MFFSTPIRELDTSGWNLNSLITATTMFQYCSSLVTLGDTSGWGLRKLTSMNATFHGCSSLQSLDTSGWSLENVTIMRQAFDSCRALQSLGDTSRWNLVRCTDMQQTFVHCTQLTKIDLTYSSTPQVTVSNLNNTTYNTVGLVSIVGDHVETDNVSVFNGFTENGSNSISISNLVNLNLASILAIIRGLGTNRTRKNLTLPNGFDKSRIPQEYKTMLENKNWELR